ncbi:MAG: MFS transporter [Psychrilyobacter sp.]|uniref:MFS transporter n=1 Tax=Psychrilyobacter sp. TaxID=2586924 RepID=UPI003C728BA4
MKTKIPKEQMFFFILAVGTACTFTLWRALINNYSVEVTKFVGKDIGLLQSVREVPGLLAVTALIFLLFLPEQIFLTLSMILFGVFVMLTGFLDSKVALILGTLGMSFGFHYMETIKQSLSYQLLKKEDLTRVLGKSGGISAFTSLITFLAIIFFWKFLGISYQTMYLVGGGFIILIAIYMHLYFPKFHVEFEQDKKAILKKKYWLYYVLTILSGARRQIFVVFAPFLLVTKFNLKIDQLVSVFIISQLLLIIISPKIGKLIPKIGEKTALIIEYLFLMIIFFCYANVRTKIQGEILYILDNLFFGLSFALSSYFKKIGDPKDMAATSSLSFTLNHTMAVIIPVVFGYIWLKNPSSVFYLGVGLALISLIFSTFIPKNPIISKETIFVR